MRLGYVIIYVASVADTMDFYSRAFGLEKGRTDPTGEYGEMKTGGTVLAFVAEEFAHSNLRDGFRQNRSEEKPPGVEIALVTGDVDQAWSRAVREGALPYGKPEAKPWGQRVGYVRDPGGILIEICSEPAG